MKKFSQKEYAVYHWRDSLLYTKSGRIFLLGCLGVIGFPSYYWIWGYLFPQPYENLSLRLIGVLLFIPLLLAFQAQEKKWFNIYFYIVITYAFPFFFVFMFLMNDASSVWAQSLVIMLAILFQFDTKFSLSSLVSGTFFAYLYFKSETGQEIISNWSALIEGIPTILFSVVTTCIVKIGRRVSTEEKLSTLATGISTAAHELRNPLAAITGYLGAIEKYTDRLIGFYKQSLVSTSTNDDIHPEKIKEGFELIKNQIYYSNSMINILVTNAWKGKNKAQITKKLKIREVITKSIELYPFFDSKQRAIIKLCLDTDFYINGDERLFVLVLHNLIKNSLKSMSGIKDRNLEIKISSSDNDKGKNIITLRDNGCGIAKKRLPYLFQRFFSYPPNSGTGIGLAFCRDVLTEYGAKIICHSEENVYTEFSIFFPKLENSV
jgi:two-component system CAI-1 autoinducer sensor kinase/phosphatase CqsS